jgi:anti-sigma B factor antagonist
MQANAAQDQPVVGSVTVTVSGELDALESDRFCQVVVSSAGPDVHAVVLDLTEVTFVGSAGISAMIRALKTLDERQVELTVDGRSPLVDHVLEITGLSERFVPRPASG